MELVNIIPDPIQFPSIYNFTFILFGNNGEIRIYVCIFDEEAVQYSKRDVDKAKEPKLLARFKWYHEQRKLPLVEEYYRLDFKQEPVVLFKIAEDTDIDYNRIATFSDGDEKFWLPFRKNNNFLDRFVFLTLDEAERRIAKEVYYNKKQALFVAQEIIGKEV
jgi:hypothetical protein